MITDGKMIIGLTDSGENAGIVPKMANRHGIVSGATGSGKTVTLKTMAEGFSDMGVPVFLADVKGDISGLANNYPANFWDIYGESGIPLRTTVSEMGPLLLSRIMGLSDVQESVLNVVFKIADDEGMLLIDTKDLKAMLSYVSERSKDYEMNYGKLSSQSISAIVRNIVALESEGADIFFGEPALSIADWMCTDSSGKGMMNILDASSLINSPKLYSTFLLWMISELFETLPEVGDMDKPKMIFFFDEAHLMFKDASKTLTDKIEQVVKLIRSKGVGVYFCTQSPKDIPSGVLSQLSNKVQHNLSAFTPADQKAVKVIADSFPVNDTFNTYETILSLGIGEAVVSFLGEDGVPSKATHIKVNLPASSLEPIDAAAKDSLVKQSLLYSKYATPVDTDSAYEFLLRRGAEIEEAKQAEAEQAAQEKLSATEALKAQREKEKEEAKAAAAKKRAIKSVGNAVTGTIGRELGKEVGKNFGSFGKTLGGNVGASVGRGLLSTFLKM